MRIYVADLSAYNNGILHGKWIEATSDPDEMRAEIAEMLRASPCPNVTVTDPETGEQVPSAEEWAIHDFEGLPSTLGEYTSLDTIANTVALIEETTHIDAPSLMAIIENFHDPDTARTELDENFVGIYSSFKDFAYELADETLDQYPGLPGFVTNYFDYDAFARDLKHEYTVVDLPNHDVAIFYA